MDAVEEIKSRLNIEDVIGDYVELKRAGRNLKGMSPWTNEKTPSLMVSPDKQIWHDFSSGKGGNMFSFVMELEGVEFKEALEILARKAGVDLSQYQRAGGSTSKLKERLSEALELAAKYYQASLVKNQSAIDYLTKKRGYKRSTIKEFQLGYAPQSETALTNFLRKRKFTDAELKSAGVGVQRRIFGDMFRGRIMVPLHDPQGRVIGFTARLLDEDPNAPKYINTPQTLLYDKGRHVYGLHLAKDAIRSSGFAVLVEGNLDVIASWQAGVKNTVATAGTALTEHHLKALSRFTTDVRLAFDQDRAGIAAAERSIPIAQNVGVQLSMITVPEGKDPDELVRKKPELWQETITKNEYVVDWLFRRYSELLDLKTATGKKQFTDVLLATIARLNDQVEQDHYLHELAGATDVSVQAMRSKLTRVIEGAHTAPGKIRKTAQTASAQPDPHLYQDSLLGLLLLYPLTRRVLEMEAEELVLGTPTRQSVYAFVAGNPHATVADDLPADLLRFEDYVKMVLLRAEQLYEHLEAGERLREARDLVVRTKNEHTKKQTRKLTEAIREAEARGDTATVQSLLDQFNTIIKKEQR